MRALFGLVATATVLAPLTAAAEDITGTYRLVGDQRKILDTGEIVTAPNPNGYIMYGKEGRMLVVITRQPRPKPEGDTMTDQQRADLYKTMSAYGGTYKFDGKTMEHIIDIAWNESWIGSHQQRFVTRDGDRLVYTTTPYRSQIDGKQSVNILTWEPVK
jgi:hypothetical protein